MFDLTSSKLLILGIVALIVVGPKDLPILLRTIGKYVGMIKRQAAEFRSQFDEAMREAELQQLKKDVETLGQETQSAIREGEKAFETEMASAQAGVEQAVNGITPPPALSSPALSSEVPAELAPAEPVPALPPASPAEAAAVAANKSGA